MTKKDDADAWLAAATLDTIVAFRDTPTVTVVPPSLSESGAHALAILEHLSGRSAIESAQLRHGDVIGEGGMGVVREAEQVALGRSVAVKTVKQPDPHAALSLLREAWVLASVEHPNVVPVHYVELASNGMPLVVMKRIAGTEWSKLVGDATEVERKFGVTDLLAWNLGILMAVLNAVRFAHHHGVIHRDLKPSNVMIGDFGEVYVLDWGIAVSLRDDSSGRLPVLCGPELCGTPAYLAPEMLGRVGDPRQSERTDVYLAGAVLYEIITGAPPHRGADASSAVASVMAFVPKLPDDVPGELARICARAMADHPDHRFESAEALRLALQGYLEHRDSVELAARATAPLRELETLLARHGARDGIYRAFGACRFGLHEALARWSDNADAKAALERATIAVAEYELVAGEPAAADSLLADVRAPELSTRIAAARAALGAERDSAAKLRADHDPNIGRRTRVALAAVFGTAYVGLPLSSRFHEGGVGEDGLTMAAISLALEVAMVIAYAWTRKAMAASLFNRRTARVMLVLFGVMIVASLGSWRTGVAHAELGELLLIIWALTAGIAAVTLDGRFAPTCVGYLLAYAATIEWPDERDLIMASANLVTVLNMILLWRRPRGAAAAGRAE